MTDNSSTPGTPEPTSKKSRSMALEKAREVLRLRRTGEKVRDPFWKTVPIGMVKRRDRAGGTKYKWMNGRPTTAAIKAGLPVGSNYNLVFVRDGQKTARTYEVTYTSPLDRSKVFRIRVGASSLRDLFRQTVYAIGNLRATETTENFSLHFEAVTQQPGMTEEIVTIPLAHELDERQKPTTDEPIEPITVED